MVPEVIGTTEGELVDPGVIPVVPEGWDEGVMPALSAGFVLTIKSATAKPMTRKTKMRRDIKIIFPLLPDFGETGEDGGAEVVTMTGVEVDEETDEASDEGIEATTAGEEGVTGGASAVGDEGLNSVLIDY